MQAVRTAAAVGLIGQLALLALLTASVHLGLVGWLVGLAFGLFTNMTLARVYLRAGRVMLGPADHVTLLRAVLVGAVAALVADATAGPMRVDAIVLLATVALALDGVDGWVARRTGTASSLGARFDTEVDALLILILSFAALSDRWWVLSIGLAHYAFLAIRHSASWLQNSVPHTYWRKSVAVLTGVALTAAAANVLPDAASDAVLAAALAAIAYSFGTEAFWLWRDRPVTATRAPIVVRRVPTHAPVA